MEIFLRSIAVGKNEANQRLDKLLIKYMPNATKGFIYKMIRKKNITLNDKKCEGNELLAEGDLVKLWLSDDTIDKFSGESVKRTGVILQPIYEDDDIVIFNKPAGLLSQKANPEDISVNEIFVSYLLNTGSISENDLKTFKPSICNRLDRNTSGLIVCGKSLKGLQEMAETLKERTAHKDYIAFVEGEVREGNSLKGYLSRNEYDNKVSLGDEGDYIETEFKPLWSDGKKSILMVRLITGKTHQIRAHLASIGHPIIGDMKYGTGKGAKRQLLHAYRLTLPSGKLFQAELPEDMKWELGNLEAFEDLPSRI